MYPRRVTPSRLALLLLCLPLACVDTFPLPDEFDAAYTTGTICAPSQVASSEVGQTYPVRFDLCLYRCVTIDRSTSQVRTAYQCAGGQCQMVLLATARAHKVDTEEGCDARNLVSPPEGECRNETLDFNVRVPVLNGQPASGEFLVTVPYLELEEGQRLSDRLEAGEDPATVIQEEVGAQNYPSRQFVLRFDPDAAPVTDHSSLAGDDCHTIGAP